MRYYGLNVHCHDAGMAIIDENGDLEFYAESQRYEPRSKFTVNIDKPYQYCPKPNKKDIVAGVSFGDCKRALPSWNPELAMEFFKHSFHNLYPNDMVPRISVNHHLCHILTSWCFRKDDNKRFALAYDGAGANPMGTCDSCLGGFISKEGFNKTNIVSIPSSSVLCNLFYGAESPGKAMGLSGYLNVDKTNTNFDCNDLEKLVCAMINNRNGLQPNYPTFDKNDINEENLKFIAKLYNAWIEITWSKIKQNIEISKNSGEDLGIVIGGGTCLALELNSRIHPMVKDVVFGPPVNDSGIALGAAAFAYFMDTGKWPNPIKTPSIMHLQESLPEVGPQDPTDIAKLIAEDKVVGLLRGKAECGPRALGFRSMFANACKYKNLKRVSEDLKGREYFRPLAPIVTAESFDRYFIGPKGEYMQYKCDCTEEAQKELPAIVHKDNSARAQVVYKEKDPWLHALLVEYGRLTGHECMINTSLNGKGKPICNTYQDAVDDFKNKDIELVSINYKNQRFFCG
jgi:predicted NodU family carbamoyl transferase